MQHLGHPSSKNFFIVDLKFKVNWGSYIVSGNPDSDTSCWTPWDWEVTWNLSWDWAIIIPHCLLVSVDVPHRLEVLTALLRCSYEVERVSVRFSCARWEAYAEGPSGGSCVKLSRGGSGQTRGIGGHVRHVTQMWKCGDSESKSQSGVRISARPSLRQVI